MLRGKFWISTILVAALGAALPEQSLHAQPTPAPASADPIQRAVAVLTDANSSIDQREDAARKLVARKSTQSRGAVANILADSRIPQSQVALARALADNPDPDEQFRNPLFAMLQGPAQSGIAAAQALGTFKNRPDIVNQLANLANDRRSEPARLAAINALGRLIEKPAAATLMELLTAPDEAQNIRNAAADALVNLADQPRIGRDVLGWQQWWTANINKTPEQFQNDLLVVRGGQFDAMQRRLRDLESDYRTHLSEEYQSLTSQEQKAAKLLSFLNSNNAVMRAEGAQIVGQDRAEGSPVPAAAQDRLRQMISDDDARVRLAVANSLIKVNDREALDPLLNQVAREEDSSVRAELAKALGPIGDPHAVPLLLRLLQDQSVVVAAAAADALADKELVPKLRADPNQVRGAADALKAAFEKTGDPATQQLRESTITAMAELGDPRLLEIFHNALSERESARVRQAAIRGIGNIHNPQTADWIARYLDDQDLNVRLAAVQALGEVSGADFAPQLMKLMEPKTAPPELQDKAWEVLQSFLPDLPTAQLQKFADDFRNYKDPKRRRDVLEQKKNQEVKAGDDAARAGTLQNIGETMMDDELKQYDDAADRFAIALDIKLKEANVPPQVINTLVRQEMEALLRAGKYKEAMDFASKWMTDAPGEMRTMGTLIKQEAERLQNNSGQSPTSLENAIKLIDDAKELKPNLPQDQLDLLQQIQDDVRQQIAKNKGNGFNLPAPDPIQLNPAGGATAQRRQ